jgi:hypothetical protein
MSLGVFKKMLLIIMHAFVALSFVFKGLPLLLRKELSFLSNSIKNIVTEMTQSAITLRPQAFDIFSSYCTELQAGTHH